MKYVALLRGINVGGHHKVPMADLKKCIAENGFSDISTLLNSGNVVFSSTDKHDCEELREHFESFLESRFGFSIPVFIIPGHEIESLTMENPFATVNITPDTRNYVTFFRTIINPLPKLPWTSEDGALRFLNRRENILISSLDISVTGTPEAMKVLVFHFSKDNTTRNWNTIEKLSKLL
ncbi:DUF1697 domain-containing protein [Fulvivirga sedimenti]|uniref:DUF1697 domain-containing protein n=1 Tax=Fulvivirga sedimenti TaxID=2879465 RepID=A0A9X1KVX3_9BACT|nr:DUF1697 domain-containing protein [Fulvivirga sedimenti]MCA6074120.1 DUF1697 domain-containing protein [Fulvivirga sedimenti]